MVTETVVKLICDRCDNEIKQQSSLNDFSRAKLTLYEEHLFVGISGNGGGSTKNHYDLCSDCLNKLHGFLKNE